MAPVAFWLCSDSVIHNRLYPPRVSVKGIPAADSQGTGPGRIKVDDRELTAEHIIIATGSEPVIPDLEGLDQITAWTNRETYTTKTLPKSAVIIGGSAVGTETGTFLSRFGVKVTLIHRGAREAFYEGIPRVVFADPEIAAVEKLQR